MTRLIQKKRPMIECSDGKYRIANISGNVPKNHNCIISGWHIKDGKIIKKGNITFISGDGQFIFKNNYIE